jgi:RimJ/RimL family protein N-acetyltransferase
VFFKTMVNETSLRQIQATDLPIIFEQQLDPEATRMAAFPARDQDAFKAHWEKVMADEKNIVRTISFRGEVAGYIGSWEQAGERKVGFWLGKSYWGKGIATAALSQLLELVKVRPLYAHAAKHNAASIRVLQKCGFTIGGEDRFPCGDGEGGEEFILMLGAMT